MSKRAASFWSGALLAICAGCGDGAGLSGDAKGAVQTMARGLANNRPDVLWQALPPSYRNDVSTLIHEFGARVDPQTYDQVFGLMRKIAAVMQRKKDFFLGSRHVADGFGEAKFRAHWDNVIELLELIARSELSTSSSLQALNVGDFLESSGRDIFAQLAEVAQLAPEDPFDVFRTMSVNVVADSGGITTLRMAPSGGVLREVKFTKVEGRWVPLDMVTGWAAMMERARANLQSMPLGRDQKGRMQSRMILAMLGSMIDQLAVAKSQKAFDEVITGMLGGFGGMAASPGK